MRYTSEYEIFCKKLAQLRTEADLTQRDMAKRLMIHHSIVGKMETVGNRKVTVLEFIEWCTATGNDPAKVLKSLQREFKASRQKLNEQSP
jgi:transcriptional regulator with XRE-family HTH domain